LLSEILRVVSGVVDIKVYSASVFDFNPRDFVPEHPGLGITRPLPRGFRA